MLKQLLAFGLLVASSAVSADEAAIRKAVETLLPEVKVEAIAKSGVLGLYEVRVATPRGMQIIYADEAGNYLVLGNIIDVRQKQDLTEARMNKLTAVNFAELPLAQAFKIVRGQGSRHMAYFTDPRCPYCRRLDQELSKVDDVTVHVFLIPIISPESAPLSKAVWCSPDRAKAWLDLMLKDVTPPQVKGDCDAPLEKNIAFSRKHRINATPTLIFADGKRVGGALPAAELTKLLDEASKPK
jgi:thiol:disulfide interchange protein DsbC